ncbi:gamma subclass chorismate mutase AroQ [Streptomyces sp. NPDC059096]|uniref:gamma subclass chorismate mutase AroQ n=1 Tax=Streptomyces sp. NPDC059096 TaxID=3346727 RepID=UPI0036D0FE60
MRALVPVHRRTVLAAAVALLFLGPAPATAAPAERLHAVADLAARRLAVADTVAAAKWRTGAPVEDLGRERLVLDAVARRAEELGGDPAAAVRIFRDQIEAGKDVQRALHRRWDADPAHAPAARPDLSEARTEINRIDEALVRAVTAAALDRAAPSCGAVLLAAAARVTFEQDQDTTHARALDRALGSVCAERGTGVRR